MGILAIELHTYFNCIEVKMNEERINKGLKDIYLYI